MVFVLQPFSFFMGQAHQTSYQFHPNQDQTTLNVNLEEMMLIFHQDDQAVTFDPFLLYFFDFLSFMVILFSLSFFKLVLVPHLSF